MPSLWEERVDDTTGMTTYHNTEDPAAEVKNTDPAAAYDHCVPFEARAIFPAVQAGASLDLGALPTHPYFSFPCAFFW